MKNRGKLFGILTMLFIITGYAVVMYSLESDDGNTKPEITFKEETLMLSVKDTEKKLLEGVKAYDREDGDLSKEIMIDSISPFNQKKERTVKYVVFDRMNQVAEAERKIIYTDYTEPEITLNGPLIVDVLSTTKINKLVGAVSPVDGDISDKVSVKMGILEGFSFDIQVNVSDSTGTQVTRTFTCEYNRNIYMANIALEKYLVKLPVGGSFEAADNINEIAVGNLVQNDLIPFVTIQDNVDYDKPGTYEIRYYLETSKGNGYTKCIVIIE